MHPIERLRYVARATGADQTLLVSETAGALAAFEGDPAGLVTACRRVISRHTGSGPLWWLCSRVLTSPEPMREAWRAADELEEDTTVVEIISMVPPDAVVCVLGWPELIGRALPRRGDLEVLIVDALGEGSGLLRLLERADVECCDVPMSGAGAAAGNADLLLIEASAIGPEAALCVTGSLAAAAVARHSGVPVWLVAGRGRMLPQRIWEHLANRLDERDEPWDRDDEVVPAELIDQVVGPGGAEPWAEALKRTDCPIAPELFRQPPNFATG